jgi:nitrogenase-associated protein
MATVTFYEKPGCGNNTKQKALLAAAGHQVIARNLLAETWTEQRLLEFFGNRPVADWFNRTAPKVKSGEILPELMEAATALQLMLQEPLLIRRPLIEADGGKEIGFDEEVIHAWLGLTPTGKELESCPRSHQHVPCRLPAESAR